MTRLRPQNIFEQLKNIEGIPLNIVLEDGKTYFGTLVSVGSEIITIRDTRQHSHHISITAVYEVIYDYENV